MHLKYTEILAIVVHECETWSQYLRIINDFVFWHPYFIALQDFNYSETWGSYETTTNLENIIFFKKKLSSGTFQNYSLICLRWPEPSYMRKGYVFRVAFLQQERFNQDFTHVFKKIEIAMS